MIATRIIRQRLEVLEMFSLTPGFSRVTPTAIGENGFNRFTLGQEAKPLKRLCLVARTDTGLKPGVNERVQECVTLPAITNKCGNFWAKFKQLLTRVIVGKTVQAKIKPAPKPKRRSHRTTAFFELP